jgi:two-component sensor histidine kinase
MERGGPPVDAPPEPSGFGSKLVHRSVSKQLGGEIEYEWAPDGLIVTLRLARRKLAS